jgi:putative SOS response-associated peptidase YedK
VCGRVALFSPPDKLSELFGVSMGIGFVRRYNIAPQTDIAAVGFDPGSRKREALRLRWGLIPSWARDEKIGRRLINARAETVATRPSFRHAFAHSRILVPVDGFYEWQARRPYKQPWFIQMKDHAPYAVAGLSETWDGGGKPLRTATLLTTTPNALVARLHDRMPVIIAPDKWDAWLDTRNKDVAALLKPFPARRMSAYRVGRWVNNPTYDTDRCIEPLPA